MNALFSFFGNKGAPNGHRQASSGVHGNPGQSAIASGAWTGRDDPEGNDPGEGAGESPSIVLGEIIAYRCWDISAGLYRSLNGTLWFADEPMKGEGIALNNSVGVYAFKTLAEARRAAKHHSNVAIGSVKLWGTIVEHENGYRGEYAMIDKIVDGPELGAKDESLRKLIAAERGRGPAVEQSHAADKATYSFRCERYGDFLSVFIARDGHKIAAALPLIGVGAITPIDGSPPGVGSVRFSLYSLGSDQVRLSREDNYCTHDARMLHVPNPAEKSQYWAGSSGASITVSDCPTAPMDDRVLLLPSGVTIFAPHGLGQDVFHKILTAQAAA